MSSDQLREAINGLELIDHHVHGALRESVSRSEFEQMITESDRQIPSFMSQMDSQIGFAIRRHCGPLFNLPPDVGADLYLEHRMSMDENQVNQAMFSNSGVGAYLLDTGYRGDDILGLADMQRASGAETWEIVRLETVFEDVAANAANGADLIVAFRQELNVRCQDAVGVKSIIAYRYGFSFDPQRPVDSQVIAAADRWLDQIQPGEPVRVKSETLLRFLLWEGIDQRLPLQLHVGYGDPDVNLNLCDPLLLTPWIKLVEPCSTPIMLLHCYPFHRHAGYLAQVFPHVFFDVGLAINYTGARSTAVIAESLELAPFAKLLFSSDAWGPAELHYLGARLWRDGMATVLNQWVETGEWSLADAVRVTKMIGRDNAARVYQITGD